MKFILYFRVSTKKQGDSGLGLDAQRTMVDRWMPGGTVLAEFTEIETGKNPRRPQLAAALAECRRLGATLVVAKLDRLARNVAFTSSLMDSGVDFVACDCPYASRLTLHILAAVAEDEATRISQRTKAALAELKAQGVKLGGANPVIAEKIAGRSGWAFMDKNKRQLRQDQTTEESWGSVIPLVRVLTSRGEGPLAIANTLNDQGFKTVRGKSFNSVTVQRILARLDKSLLCGKI